MKKLVVVESYNEIVFPEPSEVFLARVQNHPTVNVPRLLAGLNLSSPGTFLSMLFLFLLVVVFKFFTLQIFSLSFPLFWFLQYQAMLWMIRRGDTKDHPLTQWFLNFSEADELLKLAV